MQTSFDHLRSVRTRSEQRIPAFSRNRADQVPDIGQVPAGDDGTRHQELGKVAVIGIRELAPGQEIAKTLAQAGVFQIVRSNRQQVGQVNLVYEGRSYDQCCP